MGTNSKLHVQFSSRYWDTLGNNGETYADTGYQNTWEVTRAQAGASGILVDYTGGTIGAASAAARPPTARSSSSARSSRSCPGITARWNGTATVDYWTGYQWTRGPTPTGRSASTRSSPASNASRKGSPELPLRRGAHLDRLPGLPQRRRGDR